MFFFFIFVEALILKARNVLLPKAKDQHALPGYRLNDFCASSLLGSFQQVAVRVTR